MPSQRGAKAFENRAAKRPRRPAPFRMPLHAQQEGGRLWHGHRLDLAIGSLRLGPEQRCQLVHALMMQGIDGGPRQAREPRQQAIRPDLDAVGRAIFGIARYAAWLAVI